MENSEDPIAKQASNFLLDPSQGLSQSDPSQGLNKESTKKIEYIVVNGGGPLILNMYGALKKSNQLKMWEHKNIKSYYGTSAGAIICLLLALNFDWEETDAFLINCPWSNFLNFNVLEIYNYYLNNGISDKTFVYGFFTPLFGAKDINLDITFSQLYEKINADIHMFATSLKTFEIVEFSKDLTPNVKVLEAIYASTSVPIIFKPMKIDGEFYIDGCIYLHYPLSKCLEKNIDPQTVLGIKNIYMDEIKSDKEEEKINYENMTIFEYIMKIFNMVFFKIQIEPDPNIKIGLEIPVHVVSNDISSYFKMASSIHLRKLAIENGVKDVSELHGGI